MMACVTISEDEDLVFSDIYWINVDVDKGAVSYTGRSTSTDVDVEITSWARASGRANAEQKQADNRYTATATDNILTINGDTGFHQAGIDVDANGPERMDLSLNTEEGSIVVRDAIGIGDLSGRSVTLSNYEGDAIIDATSTVNAEIYPFEQGAIDIRSNGDCTVRLPMYAPVSLIVEFDPEQESLFTDLGFDDEFLSDGAYEAMRMPGDILVNIRCPNGRVEIIEHNLSW